MTSLNYKLSEIKKRLLTYFKTEEIEGKTNYAFFLDPQLTKEILSNSLLKEIQPIPQKLFLEKKFKINLIFENRQISSDELWFLLSQKLVDLKIILENKIQRKLYANVIFFNDSSKAIIDIAKTFLDNKLAGGETIERSEEIDIKISFVGKEEVMKITNFSDSFKVILEKLIMVKFLPNENIKNFQIKMNDSIIINQESPIYEWANKLHENEQSLLEIEYVQSDKFTLQFKFKGKIITKECQRTDKLKDALPENLVPCRPVNMIDSKDSAIDAICEEYRLWNNKKELNKDKLIFEEDLNNESVIDIEFGVNFIIKNESNQSIAKKGFFVNDPISVIFNEKEIASIYNLTDCFVYTLDKFLEINKSFLENNVSKPGTCIYVSKKTLIPIKIVEKNEKDQKSIKIIEIFPYIKVVYIFNLLKDQFDEKGKWAFVFKGDIIDINKTFHELNIKNDSEIELVRANDYYNVAGFYHGRSFDEKLYLELEDFIDHDKVLEEFLVKSEFDLQFTDFISRTFFTLIKKKFTLENTIKKISQIICEKRKIRIWNKFFSPNYLIQYFMLYGNPLLKFHILSSMKANYSLPLYINNPENSRAVLNKELIWMLFEYFVVTSVGFGESNLKSCGKSKFLNLAFDTKFQDANKRHDLGKEIIEIEFDIYRNPKQRVCLLDIQSNAHVPRLDADGNEINFSSLVFYFSFP